VQFHSSRGECIATARLFGYRCSDSVPPVIVRNVGADRRTYIGGRFSVAVRRLPLGAASLGRSDGTHLFAVPGDPSWLFVRQDGILSRWLPLPRTAPATPPRAFFLGDSIMQGAESAVAESLPQWSSSFDAVIGRPSAGGVAPAQALAATHDLPEVVVVELGTNDVDPAVFRANAARILSALRGVPLVVWQTAHGPMSTIADIDRAIRQTVPRSSNTSIADWNAFVPADALQADGVHPLPDRVDEVARLLHPVLTEWLEASRGRGATACGPGPGSSPR
jgi:lysophospholipase L1-like esterase